MQAAVRKSLTGAAVGAGVGAGVGILVQIAASKKARRQEQEEENDQSKQENSSVASNKKDREKSEKEMYPDLYAESEVYWLVECLKEFRSQLPESFDNLMLGLDRFCALRVLVHTAPKDEFSAGWTLTAHHHVEGIRDSLSELEVVISSPALLVEFQERRNEIEGWITNELHNISMQVQTRLQDNV